MKKWKNEIKMTKIKMKNYENLKNEKKMKKQMGFLF